MQRLSIVLTLCLLPSAVCLLTSAAFGDDQPPLPKIANAATESGSATEGEDSNTEDSGSSQADTDKANDTEEEKPAQDKPPEKKPAPKKKKVQILPISGNYVDHPQPVSLDPTALLLGGPVKQKSFYRLCDYLHKLQEDKTISGVLLDLTNSLSLNSAQLDELTRRIERLRESEKKVVAWLEDASSVQLALASACDVALMSDFGGADLPSVSMEAMFYRDAMDLVGVQASIVRAGDFKGAVEPYTNPQMSEHLRAHSLKMLKSLNDCRRTANRRRTKADQAGSTHVPEGANHFRQGSVSCRVG